MKLSPLTRILLGVIAATPLLAGCRADENTAAASDGGDTVDDAGPGLGGEEPPDAPPSDEPDSGDDDDERGDDDDDDRDEDDDDEDEGDDAEKQFTACGVGEEYWPLTRGVPGLPARLDVRSDIDRGCEDCDIDDEDDVIDSHISTSARLSIPAGVLDGLQLSVELRDRHYGIESAGFLVSGAGGYLGEEELGRIEVRLLDDGSTVASGRVGDELQVYDTGDNFRQLLVTDVDDSFDEIRIRAEGAPDRALLIEVYAPCVDRDFW